MSRRRATSAGAGHVPRVSVLMPVFDPHPVHFPCAVASVLAQSEGDFELVIVEDPSAHAAADLLAAIRDPRIRHHLNPARTSLAAQRNRTLAEARADLVALADADDVCEPTRLARQLSVMEGDPALAVLGTQLRIIDGDSRPLGFRVYPTTHAAIVAAMPRFNPVGNPSVLMRKDVALAAGGYRYTRFPANEDYELWCRLARRGARFANLPEALVRYRVHAAGLKTARLRGLLRGTLQVKRMHWGDQLDARARARMLAERALLLLPARLVLPLFMKLTYGPRLR